jgi:GNAT superfamily N-acetyltransferase
LKNNGDKSKIYSANEKDVEWISNCIKKYECSLLPDENIREVNLIIRNEKNENIGGLIANTRYATLYINDIWINEEYRNKGYGKQLILNAERQAKEMGCIFSSLGTFDVLKVKKFYEKLGYRVVSKSKDSPKGYVGYWFSKKLI